MGKLQVEERPENVAAPRRRFDPSATSAAYRACREIEAIAQTLAAKALAGDIRAAQEIADRAEGRARQAIEIEHTPLREAFERMSRAEMEAYAVSGTLPEWFPKDETVQ